MEKGFDDGGEGEVVLLQSRDLGGDRRHPSGETNFDSLYNNEARKASQSAFPPTEATLLIKKTHLKVSTVFV